MRRMRQELSSDECIHLLETSTSGILSVTGDGGYPYGVPLSHLYHDGKLYFHCALTGHKIDAIKANDKVSFTVISQDKVVEEKFTTLYRSVIVFGRATLITDEARMRPLLRIIASRFCPSQSQAAVAAEIDGAIHRMMMIEVKPDHLSGKQCIELVSGHRKNNG